MDLIEKKLQDEKLQAAIMLAVNCESTFKLFSYRCMEPGQYISAIAALVDETLPILRKELQVVENE